MDRIADQLICSKCTKTFTTIEDLKSHIKKDCSYKDPYKCIYCSKSFVALEYMKTHIENCSDRHIIHGGEISKEDPSEMIVSQGTTSTKDLNEVSKEDPSEMIVSQGTTSTKDPNEVSKEDPSEMIVSQGITSTKDPNEVRKEDPSEMIVSKGITSTKDPNEVSKEDPSELIVSQAITSTKDPNEVSKEDPSVMIVSQGTTSTKGPNEVNKEDPSEMIVFQGTTSTKGPNEKTPYKPRKGPLIKCSVEGCDDSFTFLKSYRNHLMSEKHGMDLQETVYQFANFEDFSRWKYHLQESLGIYYVQHRREYTGKCGSYRKIYYCHRSGFYKPKAKVNGRRNKLKAQGSAKLGNYCPSTMNIKCHGDGKVICTYVKTHFGHGNSVDDIMHTPIPKADKQFISEKLLQGVERKKILDELHKRGGRSEFITNKDINNHIRDTRIFEQAVANEVNGCDTAPNTLIAENSEMNELENGTGANDIRDAMFNESLQILNKLRKTLNKNSNSTNLIKQMTHHLRVIDAAVHKKQTVFVEIVKDPR